MLYYVYHDLERFPSLAQRSTKLVGSSTVRILGIGSMLCWESKTQRTRFKYLRNLRVNRPICEGFGSAHLGSRIRKSTLRVIKMGELGDYRTRI
jgi:hypothetical protein